VTLLCIPGPLTRHVILPKHVAVAVPKGRLMSEAEWRKLGVQQSRGWVHYMVHQPGEGVCLITQAIHLHQEFPQQNNVYLITPPPSFLMHAEVH